MTQAYPPAKRLIVSRYLIGYALLCQRAGVPHLTRVVGHFLVEIAEWCRDNDYPPLNSLAVNEEKGMPGDGYDKAGGFLMIDWANDVQDCIRFTSFPATMP
ncbi:hypothetical protein [Sorangium sp. So ce385]|uniref:hypothetical protein n=1 Tax=Sorangium sp. So ce385 TaxID=3133308 RepID=UPI003F5B9D0B